MADTLIGIAGKDFVVIAADTSSGRSVLRFKDDADKIMHLDKNKLMGYGGEVGDYLQFSEFIQKNVALTRYRTGYDMSTQATACFVRRQLATALRQGPYATNLLLGGYDEKAGPSLFWIDYLGGMQQMNIAAHGYGSYFTLSILDRYWTADLSEADALDILAKCLAELKTRFAMAVPNLCVKVVDKNGIHKVELPKA